MTYEFSCKISNAKFLAMIMVVAIHIRASPLVQTFFQHGVFLVAVPFFFVCSGYFLALHRDDPHFYTQSVFKRIRTIFVPYVLFISLSIVFRLASKHAIEGGLWSFLLNAFGIHPLRFPRIVPLWFLRTLFGLTLVCPVFVWLSNFKPSLAILWLATLVVHVLGLNNAPMYHFGLFWCEPIMYYSLGIWLCIHGNRFFDRVKEEYFVSMPIILTGICILFICILGKIHYSVSKLFFVPFLLVGLWRVAPLGSWPKWMTRSTFPVYLLHPFILMAVSRTMLNDERFFVVNLVATITFSVFLCNLCRRTIPSVYTVLFGGR